MIPTVTWKIEGACWFLRASFFLLFCRMSKHMQPSEVVVWAVTKRAALLEE